MRNIRTNKLLAIIIVNWEREEDTLACLLSIQKFYKSFNEYEIILIDNGSKSGIEKIKKYKFNFDINVIENDINLGFTGGNNVGINYALIRNIPFVLLLNNDTVIVDNSIKLVLEKIKMNNDYGAIGIINYYHDSPNRIWQSGFDYNFKNGKFFRVESVKKSGELINVDYVPGSSILIRSCLIKSIGDLDNNYFAFWEEIDFCLRIKKIGYKIAYLQGTKILHKIKSSTNSNLHLYLSTRNRFYFLKKFSNRSVLNKSILFLIIKFLVKKIIRKEKRSTWIIIVAIYDFYKNKLGNYRIDKFIN